MFLHKSYVLTIALLIYLCSLISVQSQTLTGPSGETILTHGYRESVAISPDEQIVAVGGNQGVFLWDTYTGEFIQRLYKEGHTIMGLAFTPDGSKLLAAGNYCILWDVETGREILSFDSLLNYTDALDISPDGKYALIGSYKPEGPRFFVDMWDLETGDYIQTFGDYEHATIAGTAFSPDMKYVVVGAKRSETDLWRIEDGEKLVSYNHPVSVSSVEFSPDGTRLLTISGSKGYLWDTLSGDLIHEWPNKGSYRFNSDGSRIVYSSRWNVDTGEPASIEYLDPDTGEVTETKTIPGYGSNCFFINDERYMIGGYDGLLQLWDLETEELVLTYGNSINSLYNAEFSPDGKTISVGSDFSAYIIDADNGSVVRTFAPFYESAYFTSLSADGRYLITNGYPTTIRLWDVETSDLLLSLDVLRAREDISACVTRDGTKLLTGAGTEENELGVIWDVATGEKIHSFPASDEGGGNYPASVFDEVSSKARLLSTYPDTLSCVATFSPDESKALTLDASRMNAILWDAETGDVLHTFIGHAQSILSAEFSKDGQYAVTGDRFGIARLWNVETGENLAQYNYRLQYNSFSMNQISLSPDNRYLLTASSTGILRGGYSIILWDTFSGERLFSFNGNHDYQITAADFSPDGTSILTAGAGLDNTIRIWRLADLIQTSFADGFELYP